MPNPPIQAAIITGFEGSANDESNIFWGRCILILTTEHTVAALDQPGHAIF
jgi:hypothetical protein